MAVGGQAREGEAVQEGVRKRKTANGLKKEDIEGRNWYGKLLNGLHVEFTFLDIKKNRFRGCMLKGGKEAITFSGEKGLINVYSSAQSRRRW